MIELLTKKRTFCLALLFILCILFVLFYEEYEEIWFSNMDKIKRDPNEKREPRINEVDFVAPATRLSGAESEGGTRVPADKEENCLKKVLTQSCQACSEFEMRALRSDHCLRTGFYMAYDCHMANETRSLYLPCPSPAIERTRRFYLFAGSMWLMAIGSFAFVQWRKKIVQQRAYARLPLFQ